MPPIPEVLFGRSISPEFVDTSRNIVSAKLYRYRLALNEPLRLKQFNLDQREGLILEITDERGNSGLSEISPLPGYSHESLEAATYKTQTLLDRIVGSDDFVDRFLLRTCRDIKFEAPSLASFGVETALLSLFAKANQVTLGEFLYGESSLDIPLNGLINKNLSEWVPEAERLVAEGFQTLKIKVGRINPELEAIGIKNIRQSIGPDVKLRLDANRSWDLETAINFGRQVTSEQIEYIEEPLQNPRDLPHFHNGCGIHFALDETLHHILDPSISFNTYTGLNTLILKPTLIACIPRLLSLVQQAKDHLISTVISSSYETDLGLSILSQLAGAISGGNVAAGLDTGSVFKKRISKKSQLARNGRMEIETLGRDDLDFNQCELIYE
ncbi:MAG: o-succinylbenzoate synthase [Candidatus Marinimicrobia bacterium]|nr:o-succinylbenzoate synthase [Candidatus Neomarinimicrobiota bacterium]